YRAFGNGSTDDFWQALTAQAKRQGLNLNVKEIMDTWVLQKNYPVVTVTRDVNDHKMIQVTQERFLLQDVVYPDKHDSPFNYRWTIPLTFTSSSSPNFSFPVSSKIYWLHKDEHTKTFSSVMQLSDCGASDSWILANVHQLFYYRVNYDKGNWLALSKQLKTNHSIIRPINRAQIINDAWSLARAQYIELETALSTLEYLHNERDYLPWVTALKQLRYIGLMLIDFPALREFEEASILSLVRG
ncbi:unnamed protein product, partial [Candidula unifasciata]